MLGHIATDRITGLKGVITAVAEFLYGPMRLELTPSKTAEGRPQDPMWLDEPRLKIGKVHTKVKDIPVVVGLGAEAEDPMTKFKGVVTGRFTFLNGCVRCEVTPKALTKDGKPIEPAAFDEGRLAPQSKVAAERPGGPHDGPTPYSRP